MLFTAKGVASDGSNVSITCATSEALDGNPFIIWAETTGYLIAVDENIVNGVLSLRDMLGLNEAIRVLRLWCVANVEDYIIAEGKVDEFGDLGWD